MDQTMPPGNQERREERPHGVSRRGFFTRARLGLVAVAGVAVFGIATTTGGVTAKESEEAEKKEKSKARDKDQDAKEKEKESKNKGDENGSNTKKKKKQTNGDDSKKKKKQKKTDPVATSPYGKYIVDGKDQYGCRDMPTQGDAQAVLRLVPKDPNNLDGNQNGIACDGSEAFMDGVPGGLMMPPFDLTPVSRPK